MFSSYLADTQTDRQTDRQTNKVWQKHNLLGGGNKVQPTSQSDQSDSQFCKNAYKKNCERNYYVKHTSLLIVCHEHKRSKTHKHKHSTLHEIPNFRRNEITL